MPNEAPVIGKQYEFLSSPEDIVGTYGGKWTGKTDLLIFDCLHPYKLNNPDWHGVIFRREYKRLEEIIGRAHKWLGLLPGLKAHWQGSPHFRFLFPSGAWLAFHNVPHLGDEEQYQGWQIADLKFDQLDEFLEPIYNYLMLQNRCGDPSFHCTTKWTANPLGVGAQWLNKRYIKKYERGKTHTLLVEHDGTQYVKTFKWIHMVPYDNPMSKVNPAYLATLASEPNPQRRRAMFDGDPDVAIGQFFDMYNAEEQLVDPFPIPNSWQLTCSIDPGWGGVCSAGLHAKDFMGTTYRIATYYERARNNFQNADGIKEFWLNNKFTRGREPNIFVAGKDAFAHKDMHAVNVSEETFASVFQSRGMVLIPAVTDRVNGWGTMKSVMPKKFKIFKGFNQPFIEEILTVMTDEKHKNDIQGRGNDPNVDDHALDDCRYNIMSTYTPQEAPKSDQPAWFQEKLLEKAKAKKYEVGDP